MYESPAMTGDMEKGISISVDNTCFPLKSNLVMANEATIPKNVFTASVTRVASMVTNSAEVT